MTKYIVLSKQGDGNRWVILGHAEANGPVAARKKVVDASNGEYLMVPVRNATFESVTVEEQQPKVTSVRVHSDNYLDVQPALPIEEPVGESIKVEGDPVAA